jgi:catechol 2,3-dioxygenase-like lactoylglutathione lyase family enzyme
MEAIVSEMLGSYEQGKISRRRLVAALAAMAGGGARAAGAGSPFRGAGLNHIALRVADIGRSREFYKNLLGLPVLRGDDSSCFLGLGPHFLTLFRREQAGLDHYCIAIDGFKPDAVMQKLKQEGLNARRPPGTDRIYFDDPDGIEVQFSAVDHRA